MLFNHIIKLGILAGNGSLPMHLVEACKENSINYCIIGLDDETNHDDFKHEVNYFSFKAYAISKILNKMRELGVSHISLAGKVRRHDLARLILDIKGAKLLALMIKNGLSDNSLLTTILKFIEREGFEIVPAEFIASQIKLPIGCITEIKPDASANADIKQGINILKGIASFDVGQSLVIQAGLILGVEAAEGTDELIKRCGKIRQINEVAPILIKISKPNQDLRVDLPCIGPNTIAIANEFGIRGIAAEVNKTLILDQAQTIKCANQHKIFITGI